MRFRRGTRSTRALAAVAAAAAATLAGALAVVVLPTAASAAAGPGSYTIVNAGSSHLCLDLPGSSTSAGVQLDLQSCAGSANQVWTLTGASTGYTITSPVSGLCLGIAGASTSAGKAVQQQACDGTANQRWTLNASGSDYQLINVNAAKCMNASGSGTSAGTLVVQNSCDSSATKLWTLNAGTSSPSPSASRSASASASPSPSSSPTPPQPGEPSVPGTCTPVAAQLAKPSNEQFTSAQESAPPDTARIQAALDSCAGTGKAVELTASGGDTAFLSGPLTVNAGEVLLVDSGVTLYASRNPADYQVSGQPKCGTLGASDGSTLGTATGCVPFIAVRGNNSAVMGTQSASGSQGVINGRGDQDMLGTSTTWWALAESAHSKTTTQQENPKLITVFGASNVTMYHISLTNSPMFNVLLEGGSGFTAWGVRIDNPDNARNTDGFDPDSASNVLITDSYINTGDDGVAVKADAGGAASHITVSNTSFWGIHGLSVGSQTNGGVQDVTFAGNYIHGGTDIHGNTASSNNGVRVKSDTSFGGTVSGVSFVNTCETGVEHLILIDPQYLSGNGSTVPNFADITIDGLKAVNSSSGKSTLNGYSAAYPLGLTLENVQLDATKVAAQYANIRIYNANIAPTGTGVTVTSFTGSGSVPSCASFPSWPGL
ncbi:MAG TPA: glycosyl hydrolase family 28 protein [Actinocrinis sp.]|uniref:glycosyl hydrolase family 28 protein n=1 Tax=Actinocrinis sp. TaxID=1920516 RepID=UPI002D461066|nr:glycosyl hydrolase family 28 protein [Actinocrinis sp.]HZU54719.1 glycosyl hydrolase family 28 protein [Actinocrinis sp.]